MSNGETYHSETADRLRKYMSAESLSQRDVANHLGYTSSVISQVLAGKYPGQEEKEDEIGRWLDALECKQAPLAEAAVFPLSTTRILEGYLDRVWRRGIFGVVYGPSGCGKTTAIEEYARNNSRVVVLTIDYSTSTPAGVVKGLAAEIGLTAASVHKALRAIKQYLRDNPHFVIIDDANGLQWNAMDLVRSIRDYTKAGLCLVGTQKLWQTLNSPKNHDDLAQVVSRLELKKEIKLPPFAEIREVVKTLAPGASEEFAKRIYREMRLGGLRRVFSLVPEAVELAAAHDSAGLTTALIDSIVGSNGGER